MMTDFDSLLLSSFGVCCSLQSLWSKHAEPFSAIASHSRPSNSRRHPRPPKAPPQDDFFCHEGRESQSVKVRERETVLVWGCFFCDQRYCCRTAHIVSLYACCCMLLPSLVVAVFTAAAGRRRCPPPHPHPRRVPRQRGRASLGARRGRPVVAPRTPTRSPARA